MSRRTVYEAVSAGTTGGFVEPRSADEAADRRRRLQGEVEQIQGQLSDRNRLDPETGLRLTEGAYNAWRRRAIVAMHAKQQELRDIKAWIGRQHDNKKASEWALLARVYRLLERLDLEDPEADRLLDDIEEVLPRSFLNNPNAEELPHTG